jgi:tRNA-dihydrouridine synthase 1
VRFVFVFVGALLQSSVCHFRPPAHALTPVSGAFLAEDWGLISRIVKAMHERISVPVTCKIRVQEEGLDTTLRYAQMIRDSGCQVRCAARAHVCVCVCVLLSLSFSFSVKNFKEKGSIVYSPAHALTQMLTVHGRTIKQKGQLTGLADWSMIREVK